MFAKRVAVVLGLAGMLLVPAAGAQAAPSDQDAAYLRAAHQSNLAEIAGGRLAQQKGQSQQVKDLGARFVADHTRLDNAADALGVPSSIDTGTGGQAAERGSATGVALLSLGALLVATAALLLWRRRPVRA